MTLRRRATAQGSPAASWYRWATNDAFTENYFGKALFPTVGAARAAWPACRREVWAQTYRFHLPRPAIVFDGLTSAGWDLAWLGLGCKAFPVDDVRAAIATDLATVAEFEQRDRKGAAAIADFLAMWREDLLSIDAFARACLGAPAMFHFHNRPQMTSAARYGGATGDDPGRVA